MREERRGKKNLPLLLLRTRETVEIGGEKKEKREREGERENEDVDKRGSHVGDGIRKSSTSAGMMTWCHNLDIEKGGATIWT